MDRRRFLNLLALGGAAGLALDVDRLLWVPGARTFVDLHIPSYPVYCSGYPMVEGMLLELEREIFRVVGVDLHRSMIRISRFDGLAAVVRGAPVGPFETKYARLLDVARR